MLDSQASSERSASVTACMQQERQWLWRMEAVKGGVCKTRRSGEGGARLSQPATLCCSCGRRRRQHLCLVA